VEEEGCLPSILLLVILLLPLLRKVIRPPLGEMIVAQPTMITLVGIRSCSCTVPEALLCAIPYKGTWVPTFSMIPGGECEQQNIELSTTSVPLQRTSKKKRLSPHSSTSAVNPLSLHFNHYHHYSLLSSPPSLPFFPSSSILHSSTPPKKGVIRRACSLSYSINCNRLAFLSQSFLVFASTESHKSLIPHYLPSRNL